MIIHKSQEVSLANVSHMHNVPKIHVEVNQKKQNKNIIGRKKKHLNLAKWTNTTRSKTIACRGKRKRNYITIKFRNWIW